MELSPEERRKIYEEEKARIEAEENLGKQRGAASTTKLEPNIAGLLCYVGLWVTGIIFLVIEQKDEFVRFHASQSIIVFGSLAIAGAILNRIPFLGWYFGVIIGVLTFILWIVLMVKAYQGQLYKVALAGNLADRMLAIIDKGVVKTERTDEYQESPAAETTSPQTTAAVPIQTSRTVEDYFRRARSGRIASSSVAIAWSFVFLIFFNFFYEYIAYYQYEVGKWVRYPILTDDFRAWLPIVTITLTLSIVGHIIVIIYDKYILRETTLIVLNLFVIGTVIALLSIFPFDFRVIPVATTAEISHLIATLALVGIVIGLSIGTLVSFIRLIASVARGTATY